MKTKAPTIGEMMIVAVSVVIAVVVITHMIRELDERKEHPERFVPDSERALNWK